MADIQPVNGARVRAIILTTQRTGSTFLTDCLRSHPDIECAGEILNGDPDEPRPSYRGPFKDVLKAYRYARSGAWLADRWIRSFYARGSAQVRCFKAMYNQLSRPLAMRYFHENPEVRVIHLRRENLLKVHVSTLLMSKRRNVQTRSPTDPVWIRVDPGQAIASALDVGPSHDPVPIDQELGGEQSLMPLGIGPIVVRHLVAIKPADRLVGVARGHGQPQLPGKIDSRGLDGAQQLG